MKQYLSLGVGVNSVAMLLLLADEGEKFETIYVDHGGDWPETRKYARMLQRDFPITIITPEVQGFSDLYEYCWHYEMVPGFKMRFCTAKFKVRPIQKHVETPSFQLLGISAEEAHRAKLKSFTGSENRFPLIERGIDRKGCEEIILAHGYPIPIKSGCYFCPFQRVAQWKRLRREHPDLFCKAEQLEDRNLAYREREGHPVMYLSLNGKKPLRDIVKDRQGSLFEEMEYPPCNCGL